MSIMETTNESLQKTVEGVKDSQKLEKAIQTGTNLVGYSLEAFRPPRQTLRRYTRKLPFPIRCRKRALLIIVKIKGFAYIKGEKFFTR